jgi:dienelactone hydrolase
MATFFPSEAYLRERFQASGRSLGLRAATPAAHAIWRQELRARLRELLGLHRMIPTAPNPRITETVQGPGYCRQRVEIDTEPGVTMPLYVLIPDGLTGPVPGLLATHGHGSGGKLAVAGVDDDPRIAQTIAQHNYDYGVQAVRRGYVVFCPDARGFGERRESLAATPEQLLNSSCQQLAHMALPLGLTVAGMWTWDLLVLLEYMQTRPEISGQKVGGIGLSGGGLQLLYLNALDDRLACTVCSGYFYGVADSLLHLSNNCACNYNPQLWSLADMGDLGALIAPRPLLIEAARQDPLNGPRGIANVLEQVAITQQAYDLLGVSDQLATDLFDGGHVWHGTVAFDWLARWLR